MSSVFDTYIRSARQLPLEVPCKRYLDEALLCMRGAGGKATRAKLVFERAATHPGKLSFEAAAPPSGSASPDRSRRRTEQSREHFAARLMEVSVCSTATTNFSRAADARRLESYWQRLRDILVMDCASDVCKILFWISIGVIFDRVDAGALNALRSQLAQSWHSVSLQVTQVCEHEPDPEEHRDWLFGALPVVLGQALYRLTVDLFEGDRSQLVAFAEPFLDKIMAVCYFESSGFRTSVETGRRARRKLLRSHVIQSPHVNQRDLEKTQHHKVQKDSQKKALPKGALMFGDRLAIPMEDRQIEMVMQQRVESNFPPTELNVDRYADFSEQGEALLDRHLETLRHKETHIRYTDMEDVDEDWGPSMSRGSASDVNDGGADSGYESPSQSESWAHSGRGESRVEFERPRSTPSGVAFVPSGAPPQILLTVPKPGKSVLAGSGSPGAHSRPTSSWKPAVSTITMITRIRKTVKVAEDQKNDEAKRLKDRESKLRESIVSEPLPDYLCERELMTSWVSPQMHRLVGDAGSRAQVLRKTAIDMQRVKMAEKSEPPKAWQKVEVMQKAESAPLLPTLSSMSPPHTAPVLSAGTRARVAYKSGTAFNRRASLVVSDDVRQAIGSVAEGHMTSKGERVSLKPSPSLSGMKAMYRLEHQVAKMKLNSFETYMKDYDIYGGGRKLRCDHVRLHKQEQAYVTGIGELVATKYNILRPVNNLGKRIA